MTFRNSWTPLIREQLRRYFLQPNSIGSTVLGFSESLNNIAPLSGTGLLKKTGATSWALVPDVKPLTASINQGRLTLQSNVPQPSQELRGVNANTLFFTPNNGNAVSLFNTGTGEWELLTFNQISLPLSGGIANTNYDIFLVNNAGLSLRRVAWSSATERSAPLFSQDGILVNPQDRSERFLGTIRMKTSSQCEDSNDTCFVWNAQNRITKILSKQMLGIGSYGYIIEAWRRVFNVDDFRLQVVSGANTPLQIETGLVKRGATIGASTGIGINSINSNSALIWSNAAGGSRELVQSLWLGLNEGYFYYQMLEWGGVEGANNIEYEGDYNAVGGTPNNGISGIVGVWEY